MTALSLYGGIVLPSAIGAVVDGVPTTSQTPLSGHFWPVLAVVPMGDFFVAVVYAMVLAFLRGSKRFVWDIRQYRMYEMNGLSSTPII